MASQRIPVKHMLPARRTFYVLRWIDPYSGKEREQSTKSKSERVAARMAREKEIELCGIDPADDRMTWARFRERYTTEYLSTLADRTIQSFNTAADAFERICRPKFLVDVKSDVLAAFVAKRRTESKQTGHAQRERKRKQLGLTVEEYKAKRKLKDDSGGATKAVSKSTIAQQLRMLYAALGWAKEMRLISTIPVTRARKPKRGSKNRRLMRGRPITETEFATVCNAAKIVRKGDAADWLFLLGGLWDSGLRLGEACELSYDDSTGFSIDVARRRPVFKIFSEHQKGDRDEMCPVAPEFVTRLRTVPEALRRGRVFSLAIRYSAEYIGKVVAKIGRRSGIVVDRSKEEFATAQTLRRSFGSRWALKVKAPILQRMMRHQSILTTLEYYVDVDAEDMADEIWGKADTPKSRHNA